jgi:hypothetical protein
VFEVAQDFVELNAVMLEIVDFDLIQIDHPLHPVVDHLLNFLNQSVFVLIHLLDLKLALHQD